jgi:hypothetical protein
VLRRGRPSRVSVLLPRVLLVYALVKLPERGRSPLTPSPVPQANPHPRQKQPGLPQAVHTPPVCAATVYCLCTCVDILFGQAHPPPARLLAPLF